METDSWSPAAATPLAAKIRSARRHVLAKIEAGLRNQRKRADIDVILMRSATDCPSRGYVLREDGTFVSEGRQGYVRYGVPAYKSNSRAAVAWEVLFKGLRLNCKV